MTAPVNKHDPKPPPERRWIAFCSIALNIVLAAILVHLIRPAPAASQLPETGETTAPSQQTSAPKFPKPRMLVSRATPGFAWDSLASTDFVAYAENLRAINCPERRACNIILPLIEESFSQRQKDLQKTQSFWVTGSQWFLEQREISKREAALDKERLRAVRQALHYEWNTEALNALNEEEVWGVLGFMPVDKCERAACIIRNFGDRFEAVRDQSLGIVTPDDIAEEHRLYDAAVNALSSPTELGSADLEEARLRIVCIVSFIFRSVPKDLPFTGAEFRHLIRIRDTASNPIMAEILKEDFELRSQLDSNELQFFAGARQLLGDSRFIVYLRHENQQFGQLAEEFGNIPAETLLSLFDITQQAQAQALPLRDQRGVLRSQREQQLEALRESAYNSMEELLGEAFDPQLIRTNSHISNLLP